MNKDQHGHYFQLFEWMDEDGQPTNTFARFKFNSKRPLKQSDNSVIKESKWNKIEKKMEKGGLIKARWFIKKDGEFKFPSAKVSKICQSQWSTNFRHQIDKILESGKIKSEQKDILRKNLHENPKKIKLKIRKFMNEEKENDFYKNKLDKKYQETKILEKMIQDATEFIEHSKKGKLEFNNINIQALYYWGLVTPYGNITKSQ
jgi:hypothetical protein